MDEDVPTQVAGFSCGEVDAASRLLGKARAQLEERVPGSDREALERSLLDTQSLLWALAASATDGGELLNALIFSTASAQD